MLAHIIVWTLIALYVVSIGVTIGTVGKPRRPVAPGAAAASTMVGLAYIVGLFYVHTQL